jgi:DNA-binding MarR family transcriptional regulator
MSELRGPLASTGYWLKLVALFYQRELDATLRPFDLTTTQFSVLAGVSWLGRHGASPTQQQVADFAGIDRMMTSKIVALLARRRLIRRTPRAGDARVRCLELTERGRERGAESVAGARAVDRRLFGEDSALRDLLLARFGHLAGEARTQR